MVEDTVKGEQCPGIGDEALLAVDHADLEGQLVDAHHVQAPEAVALLAKVGITGGYAEPKRR